MAEKELQSTMVFGIHPVIEAIEAGKEFEKVFLKRGLNSEAFITIRKMLRKRRIPYQDVPQEKLSRLTRKNHQGIVALLSPVEYVNVDEVVRRAFDRGEEPLILVLDRVSDVGNFGAICRSAECAGVHGILVPTKGSAQLNSFAVKSSAGAIFN
ncbi:MAG: RNA methyltransferase, partial [Bacteroidetes bacterium]|nr:RNA methyltransferase [Bacteroidota bacterium]